MASVALCGIVPRERRKESARLEKLKKEGKLKKLENEAQ